MEGFAYRRVSGLPFLVGEDLSSNLLRLLALTLSSGSRMKRRKNRKRIESLLMGPLGAHFIRAFSMGGPYLFNANASKSSIGEFHPLGRPVVFSGCIILLSLFNRV